MEDNDKKNKKKRKVVAVDTNDTECLLSDDLIKKLVDSSTASENIVISSNKRKLQKKSKDYSGSSPDIVQAAAKISKARRKRELQILRRKEGEKLRETFIATINENVISEQERGLLNSSKDIGHGSAVSLRVMLSRLLKRQRAGLELSPSELELLYSQGNSAEIAEDSISLTQIVPTEIVHETKEEAQVEQQQTDGQLLFDTLPSLPSSEAPEPKKKKQKRKQKPNNTEEQHLSTPPAPASASASAPASAASHPPSIERPSSQQSSSIERPSSHQSSSLERPSSQSAEVEKPPVKLGLSLLEQLEAIRSKRALPASSQQQRVEEPLPVEVEEDLPASGKPYVPHETVIPVSATGGIIPSSVEKDKETAPVAPAEGGAGHAAAEKTHTKKSRLINRPEDVLLSRMNLPICGMEQEIVEAIQANDVVILCGETGSGKSTQAT